MKKWKTFEKYFEKTSMFIIGAYRDSSCFDKAYLEMKRIIEEERRVNPEYGLTLGDLDEVTEDEYGFFFFLDEYMDVLEMKKSYDQFLCVCDELCEIFKKDDDFINDIYSRKSIMLTEIGKNKEAIEFCKKWLNKNKTNISAASALVRALTKDKSYDEALALTMNYIDNVDECYEHNDIMFYALSDLYKAMGKKKEMRKINKVIKEYEDYMDAQLLNEFEDDDDDWFF